MWPNRSWSSASRAVSGCLEFPGASSSFLATTLYTARLTGACSAALRANQKKQSPRGLRPTVEGWRLIATDDCQTTYENSRTCQAQDCRLPLYGGLIVCWCRSRGVFGGLVVSLTGLC